MLRHGYETIRDGHIADGVVDERSISDVKPEELFEFTQCHFFAGIGVWSMRSRSAGWKTTDQSGQDRVLANLSAVQATEKGWLTSGTSGLTGFTSSKSADLQRSLESRLQAKTASVGSTLYKLTWKERTTPSGLSISALRASVRRTSGNVSGSWPTPTTRDHKGGYQGVGFGTARSARTRWTWRHN